VRITLLGPQRRPRVDAVVRSLGLTGPFATVTAGWQEREAEDAELDALLAGRSVNLALYRRFGEVLAADPEYAAAVFRRREVLAELAALYLLRLDLAVRAVHDIRRHDGSPGIRDAAEREAVQAIRDLDAGRLAAVGEVDAEFYAAFPPHEREPVAAHRAEIARLLSGCPAFVMAGGHVGVLAETLHLFNIAAMLHRAGPDLVVLAWSAGAMSLTERIVLFHDRSAHGPAVAEIHGPGLGLVPALVALPSAHRRLRMDDHGAMSVLARRFAPARCLVLEAGDRVDLAADGGLPAGAAVLGADGRVHQPDPAGEQRTASCGAG
jgi:hypothetical protein